MENKSISIYPKKLSHQKPCIMQKNFFSAYEWMFGVMHKCLFKVFDNASKPKQWSFDQIKCKPKNKRKWKWMHICDIGHLCKFYPTQCLFCLEGFQTLLNTK